MEDALPRVRALEEPRVERQLVGRFADRGLHGARDRDAERSRAAEPTAGR
jgi:hypothetical protein